VEPERNGGVDAPVHRLNWTTIALIGGLVLLVLVIIFFATRKNADQDKLTNAQVTASTAPSREKLCASQATYDLIKRDLFRRAAQLRGSDQAAYDQISGAAVVRMENPVMVSEESTTGAVHCSGSLSLDLPPGVAIVGGRRTLTADVDYSVQQAADGSGPVVLLSNADAIVAPLATLARVAAQAPADTSLTTNETAPEGQSAAPVSPTAPAPPTTPAPAVRPQASPRASFDCSNARTRGEIAVCQDSGLAGLDRAMASEYGQASAVATPEQREILRQTAHRFYAYRDRCPDRQCIAAAYAGRVREIRDIIEGRWQPQR
jgi:hypothetical protein